MFRPSSNWWTRQPKRSTRASQTSRWLPDACRDTIGWVYHQYGRNPEAEEQLRTALAEPRPAPIGLAWHGDEERIVRLASQVSELTHGHPAATAGGVATALLVSWALDGVGPEGMLQQLVRHTRSISEEFAAKIEQVPTLVAREPESAYAVLGEGWVADEAVACALYAFWRSPRDYRRTVIMAINMDGDSDSVGCSAGAISGAYNGVDAIPGQIPLTYKLRSPYPLLLRTGACALRAGRASHPVAGVVRTDASGLRRRR
jgi:ADP-ribosylglycohydrolase